MKNIILIISLVASTQSAFAMGAYATDNCVVKTIQGSQLEVGLVADKPASPRMLVGSRTDNGKYLAVDFNDTRMGVPHKEQEPALVLESKGNTHVVTEKTSDGCYEGERSTSIRAAKVVSVDANIAQAFGLKKGQTLYFSCYQEFSAPTGDDCGR